MSATTLEIAGGFTSLLEKLENGLDNNSDLFPGKSEGKFGAAINFLETKVNDDDELVFGFNKLDEKLVNLASEAIDKLPSDSISLGVDYLTGDTAASDFEALNDASVPVIFGGTEGISEGGLNVSDLLGVLPDAFPGALPDGIFGNLPEKGLFDDLDDLFPGGKA